MCTFTVFNGIINWFEVSNNNWFQSLSRFPALVNRIVLIIYVGVAHSSPSFFINVLLIIYKKHGMLLIVYLSCI